MRGTRSRRAALAPALVLLTILALSACTPVAGPGSAAPSASPPAATGGAPAAGPATPDPAAPPASSPPATTAAPASTAPPASTVPPASTGPAAASAALPFDLPSRDTLRASSKLVFAHYFTPYPLSLDNQPPESDYYTRQYLSPDGEGGKFAATGGLLRQRPLPRAPLSGDYVLEDLKTEVRRAIAAGLDGFTVDVLEYSGRTWDATLKLITAAEQVDPGFKIMLMPDLTSLPGDPAALSAAMTTLGASRSVFRLGDGRLVVSPFAAERQSPDWWAQWLRSMADSGSPVALVPVFVDPSQMAAFEPFSYGLSTWGSRNPAANADLTRESKFAHSRGKIWMQPVSAQDQRPRDSIYDEALNTTNLRLTWTGAIENGAEWVQIPTWNDYSEGAEIAPSTHTGYVFLDLCSYYLTWFKTGSAPPIVRDVAYLTHRVQFAAMRPAQQTSLMSLRPGSSPTRDAVEVLTFLTAPAAVTITAGASSTGFTPGAGLTVLTVPLALGPAGVRLERGGSLLASATSPFPVLASAPIQDLQYYGVSTSRSR